MNGGVRWHLFFVYSYTIGLLALAYLMITTASLFPVRQPLRLIRGQATAHADEAYGVRSEAGA